MSTDKLRLTGDMELSLPLECCEQSPELALVVGAEPHVTSQNSVADIPAAEIHYPCSESDICSTENSADGTGQSNYSIRFAPFGVEEDRILRRVLEIDPLPQPKTRNSTSKFGRDSRSTRLQRGDCPLKKIGRLPNRFSA